MAAHILLPRLNRLLPGLYVPDYFTGRTRTADGLLGHPVTLRSSWHFIRASLLRRSYPTAPVSALFVFQRRQTLAFEREVDGSPARRHPVRFWVCPGGWKLPGGFDVDLVGAPPSTRSGTSPRDTTAATAGRRRQLPCATRPVCLCPRPAGPRTMGRG